MNDLSHGIVFFPQVDFQVVSGGGGGGGVLYDSTHSVQGCGATSGRLMCRKARKCFHAAEKKVSRSL